MHTYICDLGIVYSTDGCFQKAPRDVGTEATDDVRLIGSIFLIPDIGIHVSVCSLYKGVYDLLLNLFYPDSDATSTLHC